MRREPLTRNTGEDFRLTNLSTKRQRIAELARTNRGVALSSLHHVIDLEWLKEAYRLTRKDGAPGIDGVMANEYAANLEANLLDLLDRISRVATKRRRSAGHIFQKRTARVDRSAYRPSKTRWRKEQSLWCWRRCTSRTSFPAHTISGPAARLIKHYRLCVLPS